jgi:hypothetical protein
MSKTSLASSWFGILAAIVMVFGSIEHAAKSDPVGHVSTASVAVHGVVIPPFNR